MSKNRKIVLFIGTSLDGYIATEDESLEWLDAVEGEGDNGYSEFLQTVDTILMGRKTYDWVMKATNGKFPYENESCYVYTRSPLSDTEDVKFIHDDVIQFTKHLQKQNGKDIWLVGGGELIYTFIQENLLDELIITIAPTILGKGIPLFKKGDHPLDLRLIGTRTFNQFVELHYVVEK